MGMEIYVNKLSDKNEDWTLDVEASDNILGVKAKILDKETSGLFTDTSKIRLFINFGTEVQDSSTLSDYGIEKEQHINAVYTADITVCGTLNPSANGLYNIWGWDPGGKNVYIKLAGTDSFHVVYDGNRWLTTASSDWSGAGVFAYSSNVPSANAITPYNESAFPTNVVGVWESSVSVLEGNVSCPLTNTCDSIFDKFAYGDEDGCERFRRLRLLGYI